MNEKEKQLHNGWKNNKNLKTKTKITHEKIISPELFIRNEGLKSIYIYMHYVHFGMHKEQKK